MQAEHTALVTGGMGCLGTAIAEALHDAGHRVIVTHSPGRAEVQAWLDAHAAKGRRFLSYAMDVADRSEEHTSELQSLMRSSYGAICLRKKQTTATRARRQTEPPNQAINTT